MMKKYKIGVCLVVIMICTYFGARVFKANKPLGNNRYEIFSTALDSLIKYDINTAEKKVDSFYSSALAEVKDKEQLGYAYYFKSILEIVQEKYDSLAFFLLKGENYAMQTGSEKLHANYNKLWGHYYLKTLDFPKSIDNYFKALNYYEANNNRAVMAEIYSGISGVYFYTSEMEQAEFYSKKSLEIYEKINFPQGVASSYSGLAMIYMFNDQLKLSKEYLSKSTEIRIQFKDTLEVIDNTLRLATIELAQGDLYETLRDLDYAYSLSVKNKNISKLSDILFSYGQVAECTGDYVEAEAYYSKSDSLMKSKSIGMRIRLGCLDALARIAEKQKDYEKSNRYLKSYYSLKDSVIGGDVKQKIETSRWNSVLEKQNYQQEAERQVYRNHRIIYFLIVALLTCIGLFMWFLYRNKDKSFKISQLEKEKLEEKRKLEQEYQKLQLRTYESELKTENKLRKDELQRYQLESELKNRELIALKLQLLSNNESLGTLQNLLKDNEMSLEGRILAIERFLIVNLDQEKGWEQFQNIFHKIHPTFFANLQKLVPELTKTEVRICAYIKINMNNNEIASLLGISVSSVLTNRYRIRKKINLERAERLEDWVQSL